MAQEKVSNGNGANRISTTISLLAMLVAIAFAIFEPLSTQMSSINQQVKDHEGIHGHPGITADISEIRERFVGVDNGIKNLIDSYEKQIVSILDRLDKLEQRQITHIEKDVEKTAELKANVDFLKRELERIRGE